MPSIVSHNVIMDHGEPGRAWVLEVSYASMFSLEEGRQFLFWRLLEEDGPEFEEGIAATRSQDGFPSLLEFSEGERLKRMWERGGGVFDTVRPVRHGNLFLRRHFNVRYVDGKLVYM